MAAGAGGSERSGRFGVGGSHSHPDLCRQDDSVQSVSINVPSPSPIFELEGNLLAEEGCVYSRHQVAEDLVMGSARSGTALHVDSFAPFPVFITVLRGRKRVLMMPYGAAIDGMVLHK